MSLSLLISKSSEPFSFIHAIVHGSQRRCAGQRDTISQLGSLQNSFPWIFTDGRQGCQGSIRGSLSPCIPPWACQGTSFVAHKDTWTPEIFFRLKSELQRGTEPFQSIP